MAPSIAQDIRYASSNNFTAAPLPGYGAPECVLRREAAEALARVQAELARQHSSLKTYDCYRPERAVRAMWRWAHDGGRDGNKSFYPNTDKRELFTLGYIAARSKHSTGTAVDLTLIPLGAPAPLSRATLIRTLHRPRRRTRARQFARHGHRLRLPRREEHHPRGRHHPRAGRARETLRAAMSAHGFRNYFREWWHYEFTGAPLHAYDFPIEGR